MPFLYVRCPATLILAAVLAAASPLAPAQDDEDTEAPDISERVIERYKQMAECCESKATLYWSKLQRLRMRLSRFSVGCRRSSLRL